jgi:cysteine desulfurase
VEVHDGGSRRSGIVTFTLEWATPAEVVAAAHAAGINVTASGSASARLDEANPDAVVRASPHYYNTTDELEALVEVVSALRPGQSAP